MAPSLELLPLWALPGARAGRPRERPGPAHPAARARDRAQRLRPREKVLTAPPAARPRKSRARKCA
eukprot:5514729-Pyramimonas_sp.AAC.1